MFEHCAVAEHTGMCISFVHAGHSLGGALALYTFLGWAAAAPEMRLSLAYGGVFTFKAPAVVHSQTDESATAHLAQHLSGHQCKE